MGLDMSGKPFLLFAGASYYPDGGWDDFVSAHETLADAVSAAEACDAADWWQIVEYGDVPLVIRAWRKDGDE